MNTIGYTVSPYSPGTPSRSAVGTHRKTGDAQRVWEGLWWGTTVCSGMPQTLPPWGPECSYCLEPEMPQRLTQCPPLFLSLFSSENPIDHKFIRFSFPNISQIPLLSSPHCLFLFPQDRTLKPYHFQTFPNFWNLTAGDDSRNLHPRRWKLEQGRGSEEEVQGEEKGRENGCWREPVTKRNHIDDWEVHSQTARDTKGGVSRRETVVSRVIGGQESKWYKSREVNTRCSHVLHLRLISQNQIIEWLLDAGPSSKEIKIYRTELLFSRSWSTSSQAKCKGMGNSPSLL